MCSGKVGDRGAHGLVTWQSDSICPLLTPSAFAAGHPRPLSAAFAHGTALVTQSSEAQISCMWRGRAPPIRTWCMRLSWETFKAGKPGMSTSTQHVRFHLSPYSRQKLTCSSCSMLAEQYLHDPTVWTTPCLTDMCEILSCCH